MNGVTSKGQSVEEAILVALKQLGVTRNEIEYKVIEEAKRGFLGLFGNRPAVVEVQLKKVEEITHIEIFNDEKNEESLLTPVQAVESYLDGIIKEMNLSVSITVQEKGRDLLFTFEGEQAHVLIGKRGITLNALQQLAQLVANKHSKTYIHVILDAENYREKRVKTLESLANKVASQVIRTRKTVHLEPMPSYDRKSIHQALTNHKYVETTSNGQEPNRYVTISLKKNS